MNLFIKAEGRNWNAHTSEIFRLLGLKGSKLPVHGMSGRFIQGILVWVEPFQPRADGRKSSKHRVMAQCPMCAKNMSVGRLHQHAKIHKEA